MEYKNYEEWEAEGEKVQAELNRVDEQRRQARIDGDNDAYVRLEDEYNRLLRHIPTVYRLLRRLDQLTA